MKFFKKPIFTGFMPNMEGKDVAVALSFFLPWNWSKIRQGNFTIQVEKKLREYFSVLSATTFDSGRSALYFSLLSLGIKKDDEVLVQSYTCGVVSNAIVWTSARPVYVDVKNDFTMDEEDLKKKITAGSKVLIIQHTFGIPSNIDALMKIAKEKNLRVVEDCAHIMGGTYRNKFLGKFGDIGMISFGVDKALSCGRGGALITQDPVLAKKIQSYQKDLSQTPLKIVLKQLMTFFIFYIFKPVYNIGIGKMFLGLGKKFHLLSRTIEPKEKQGKNIPFYPSLLPNALSKILLFQISKLQKMNDTRLYWKNEYQKHVPTILLNASWEKQNIFFLRFPLTVQNPKKLHALAKEEGILLGDWYNAPIAPQDMNQEKMYYTQGSCPNAELLARQSINLPTHFQLSENDFKRIIKVLMKYANT